MEVSDTLTLSAAATVVVRGRLTGSVLAQGSDPDAIFNGYEQGRADMTAKVGFFLPCEESPPFCESRPFGGYSRDESYSTRDLDDGSGNLPTETQIGSGPIDDSFEVSVPLQAGENGFTAELSGGGDSLVYGGDSARSAGGKSDFGSTLTYEIVVPAGVTATSESGRMPIVHEGGEVDTDGDGVVDSTDNCPNDVNADQADLDGDGKGDVCDSDKDGDSVANASDNCPSVANADQADTDDDGAGDACDPPKSPAERIRDLIGDVRDADLQRGVDASLRAELWIALELVQHDRSRPGCVALQAFLHEVHVLAGRRIPADTADAWIDEARSIQHQLGC